jgi:hypothetical protein
MSGSARVAVIAIHGVGDHPRFEMARSITNILADLEIHPLDPRYCAFGESTFDLNVAPVVVPRAAHAAQASGRAWGPLDRLYRSRVNVDKAVDANRDSLDHRFMEGQLKDYKGEGPDDTYRVLRLEGKRKSDQAGLPEKEVHVYDMWWSDLSTVAPAGLRTFGELYQLLFHLGSVGVHNVKAAAMSLAETPAAEAWRWFSKAQELAVSTLAWPIPLLNFNILAVSIAVLAAAGVGHIGPAWGELAAAFAVLLAVVIGLCGNLLFNRPRTAAIAALIVFAGAGVAGFFVWNFRYQLEAWRNPSELVVLVAAAIAAFYGIWLLLGPWDSLRPGTKNAFIKITVVHFVASVPLMFWRNSVGAHWPLEYALRPIEVAFWFLVASWGFFWLFLVAALVTGKIAVAMTPDDEKERARRTNWTARLTLALPALIFVFVTFAGWAGFLHIALPALPHSHFNPPTCDRAQSLCYIPIFGSGTPQLVDTWAKDTLIAGGMSVLPFLLVLTLLATIVVLWAILPSALDEVSPPKGFARWARDAFDLGEWLDSGYRYMRTSGRLIYISIFLFPLFSWVILYLRLSGNSGLAGLQSGIENFTEALGLAVAGAGVALLGFGGRLSKLALGFRPLVRVGLDVDNWMREHPANNPTARICGRYVSLLRYIGQWKGQDDKGYDALIIFSHSQGTVITTDLFRFLKAEARACGGKYEKYDPTLAALDRMQLYLFTMGSPLRQLYGLRFPYLYGYAPAHLTADHLPNPEDLGVCHWTNAYRTGDYVGRYLWRDNPWTLNKWTNGSRTEFPIGPGAHTHYWDNSDGHVAIAEELDAIIGRIQVDSAMVLKK